MAFGLLTLFGFLSVLRAYQLWTTGYVVSDEVGYLQEAWAGTSYATRYFFADLNYLLFRALHITNMDGFVVFLPFYLFTFDAITILSCYKILRLLKVPPPAAAASLLSVALLPVYAILSVGFLTEPVGTAMIMSGIYALLRFLTRPSNRELLSVAAAGLLFSAALYTREPYVVYLAALPFIVLLCSVIYWRKTKAIGVKLITAAFLIALCISVTFMLYPSNSTSSQAAYLTTSLGSEITQVTTTSVSNETSTYHVVQTIAVTETTSNRTVVQNETVTSTSTSTFAPPPTAPSLLGRLNSYIRDSTLGNTFLIFFGGIFLGWNPILFLAGASAVILLMRKTITSPTNINVAVLILVLAALVSYLGVSFIFSSDPTYLDIRNYSTILRFSDTAIPAFFLASPFIFSRLGRRTLVVFATVLILGTSLLIPVYTVYASSNLQSNPFTFSYRAPAVAIRDYSISHPGLIIRVMGYNTSQLDVGLNYTGNIRLYPYLTANELEQTGWTSFLLFSRGQPFTGNLTYLNDFNATGMLLVSRTIVQNSTTEFGATSLIQSVTIAWAASSKSGSP